MTDANLNYLDLFSGVGGFGLGAEWAGIKWHKHYYSEIDNYCNKLYKQNFPDSIELGDITKINTSEILKNENEWIITGGFPCQDLSVAGKRAGIIDGERSGLWFEHLRIISELRPQFAIIENVPGLIISGGIGVVLSGLAEIGYDAEWQSISAAQIGAWHERKRVWIVAYPTSERHKKRQWSQGPKIRRSKSTKYNLHVDWEKKPSEFLRVDDGLPGRVHRIKGLGNSIVPQIAEYLFNSIRDYL